jgi:hypothetical protein
MNEYNERVLKTVLQDYRAENDDELLKEIEDAKNDPLFQVSDEEAASFAKKYVKKNGKKNRKLFLKVASVILTVVLAGAVFVPVTVEGKKNTLAQHLIYYINSEFLAFGTDDDSQLLLSYEGEFVPSYIPEGYYVDFVNNSKDFKELVLKNSEGKKIMLSEQKIKVNITADHKTDVEIKEIDILGHKGIYYIEDNVQYVIVKTDKLILNIICNNEETNLLVFAEKIEKR